MHALDQHAGSGIERVAIVDFDIHHGNGTGECFNTKSSTADISCESCSQFDSLHSPNIFCSMPHRGKLLMEQRKSSKSWPPTKRAWRTSSCFFRSTSSTRASATGTLLYDGLRGAALCPSLPRARMSPLVSAAQACGIDGPDGGGPRVVFVVCCSSLTSLTHYGMNSTPSCIIVPLACADINSIRGQERTTLWRQMS